MYKTLAGLIALLPAFGCAQGQKDFQPKEFAWALNASYCITGRFGSLQSTKEKCAEEEIVKVVGIYNQCGEYLFEINGRPASLPYDCKKYMTWLPELKTEVDRQNEKLLAETKKNNLQEKVNQCLRSVDGYPSSYSYKNAFGDYRDGPHPNCAGVLAQAQSEYMGRKKWSCNQSMESYSRKLGKGDYYGARSSLNSAVEDCS